MDRKLPYLVLIPIFIFAIHTFNPVFGSIATTHYDNILFLDYNEGCNLLFKYHYNNTCPKLQDLMQYDTSNQNISGKFYDVNGTWFRTNPQSPNHYAFYDRPIICVDCKYPNGFADVFKSIIIGQSDVNYNWVEKIDTSKGKLSQHTNLFVSEDCRSASLPYDKFLLNDTIAYMLSNCTITHYNNTSSIPVKNTAFDINSSISLKYKAYQDAALKLTKNKKCIIQKCVIPKDPFKKANWG